MKEHNKRTIHSIEQNKAEEEHETTASAAGTHMGHGNAQPMAKAVKGFGN